MQGVDTLVQFNGEHRLILQSLKWDKLESLISPIISYTFILNGALSKNE